MFSKSADDWLPGEVVGVYQEPEPGYVKVEYGREYPLPPVKTKTTLEDSEHIRLLTPRGNQD